MIESHTLVPFFLEAKDRRELVQKMLDNNAHHGGFVKYFDIQKDGAKWIAWYYEDLKNMILVREPEDKKPKVSGKKLRKTS